MKRPVKNKIFWVGKVDWELRRFHGHELSTHRGSSYNAYLLQEEKTVLIDTAWKPFAEEFVRNLEKEIPLERIDAVVAQHAEIDHSGSLPELMKRIPRTPVYCTANAVKSLKGHYHQDWNFQVVKTGDRLPLGDKELVFIEAPLLHWPDSMMSYLAGDAVLFSNDAFGQHYASEFLFNDEVDTAELYAEALKYYANILSPFSPLVTKKIEEILALKLPVEMICPSHGVIWREQPLQIVDAYQRWAADYQEDQVTIVYDTMWEGTRRLAEAAAGGLTEAAPTTRIKIHSFTKITHGCCHDGQARGHGLKNGHGQSFADTGKEKDVGSRQKVGDVLSVTQEAKSLALGRLIHTFAEPCLLGTVAHHQQTDTRPVDLLHRGDCRGVVFERIQPCHLDDGDFVIGEPKFAANFCPARFRGQIRSRVDAVRNDIAPMLGNAFLGNNGTLDGLGNGDHSVTVAEY